MTAAQRTRGTGRLGTRSHHCSPSLPVRACYRRCAVRTVKPLCGASGLGEMVEKLSLNPEEAVKGAFGAKNRARLIDLYFAERARTHAPSFEHVYRLLLWIDQTTGLAHCYESDKSQPGKNWY